jgi:hypothetical protein
MSKAIRVIAGLGNRLRAMLWNKHANGVTTFVWHPDAEVSHARFQDVFQPIPGIEVVDSGPYEHAAFECDAKNSSDWMQAYRELMPTYALQARIAACKAELECGAGYAAVHVRRLDHLPHAANMKWQFYSVSEFIRYLRDEQGCNVFAATDNAETQSTIRAQEPGVFFAEEIRSGADGQSEHDHRRHTTLQHAVVDLFVCAGAKRFLGSPGSSFSETIDILRWLNGLRDEPPELVSLT